MEVSFPWRFHSLILIRKTHIFFTVNEKMAPFPAAFSAAKRKTKTTNTKGQVEICPGRKRRGGINGKKMVLYAVKQSKKIGKEGFYEGKGQQRHIQMLCLAPLKNLAPLDVLIPNTRAKDNVNCRECSYISGSGQNISSASVKPSALLDVTLVFFMCFLWPSFLSCDSLLTKQRTPPRARLEDGKGGTLNTSWLPSWLSAWFVSTVPIGRALTGPIQLIGF